ncbi:PD-(D/E)XK nuclease family protein [Spongiibacter nanhainus]|uniref:PD-(D/E)XK nuclease family protein n=1 Tax=Spongiibacter nanhainus TaxID=2794344 RepID=A0A7T4R0X6_9GAMM|nr:PD-(D/E)XK nuclease family protein [Spongiibacter nanhainus]QQD18386.1 PD-(D/E)XK nuclease family protein [Spongiibacter nanhainus]
MLELDDLLSLDGHSVVLMPSDASARQLRDEIARARSATEGDQAFLETLSVMPPEQWLAELWDSQFADRQVLRPVQLLALAQAVIEDSDALPDDCLNSTAISRQFVDAFQRHADYLLSDDRQHYLFSREYQAFYQWREVLQAKLDADAALASSQLPSALLARRQAGATLPLPDHLLIGEHLRLTPAQRRFVDACSEAMTVQDFRPPQNQLPRRYRFSTDQIQQECRGLAAWLRQRLPAELDVPPPQIGIVVPDVNRYRATLDAALRRDFYPPSALPWHDGVEPREPWVWEGQETLLGYPLIRAAWDIIGIGPRPLPYEQLSRVLRSRFVSGWPEQRYTRAEIDLNLRKYATPELTLTGFLAQIPQKWRNETEALAPLSAVSSALSQAPSRQLPSEWVRFFDGLLVTAGWPNAADDDPVVMQCRKSFSQAMDVFRALDRQLGPVDHSTATRWLQHIISGKRFAIARDWHCPIRILGYDEAVGLHFDHLWLLGLDDRALPRPAQPSPFLPLALQRQAGIVDSEPRLQLAWDRELLNALLGSAGEVVASHCREDENGGPLSPCSLLNNIELMPLDNIDAAEPAYRIKAELPLPNNDAVRAIPPERRSRIRGGTGLFKEYAQSPFFAFAKYRLALGEFEMPAEGLDHRSQGQLLHDSLQKVWTELKDKDHLDALNDGQVEALVGRAVEAAIAKSTIPKARLNNAVIKMEAARLVAVITQWLIQREKQRTEPFAVVETEVPREGVLMGIPLRLRLDRVDQIGDKRLLIDYKSGAVDNKSWNVDDLSEPQLPIYAVMEAEQGRAVDGIMLAQLKSADELKIVMRSNWVNSVVKKRAAGNDVDSAEKWQGDLQSWSTALQSMAEGILGGDIAHDFNRNHHRGFGAYLLPLVRESDLQDGEGEA